MCQLKSKNVRGKLDALISVLFLLTLSDSLLITCKSFTTQTQSRVNKGYHNVSISVDEFDGPLDATQAALSTAKENG
jgi:hypothetical protein